MTLLGNCFATSILAVCWCHFCCSVERLANQLAFVPPRPHNYYLIIDTKSEREREGENGSLSRTNESRLAMDGQREQASDRNQVDDNTCTRQGKHATSSHDGGEMHGEMSDDGSEPRTSSGSDENRHCIYMSSSSSCPTEDVGGGRWRKHRKIREGRIKLPYMKQALQPNKTNSPMPAHILLSSELRKEPYFVAIMKYVNVTALTTRSGSTIPTFMIYYENSETVRERQLASTPTLLFSHGNATDCVLSLPLLIEMSRRLQINVFTYEYTGYGGRKLGGCEVDGGTSEGSELADVKSDTISRGSGQDGGRTSKHNEIPTISNTLTDIEAAFSHLVDDLSIPASNIIVYGQSVGTGPSCHLCSQQAGSASFMGLVLHSALASGLRVLGNDHGACAPAHMLGVCDVYVNKVSLYYNLSLIRVT